MGTNFVKLQNLGIEPEKPKNRAQGQDYVNYRSLLITNRAVWRKKTEVWFSTAGHKPQIGRLRCTNKRHASRVGSDLVMELRKSKSDDEYNATLMRFLEEIRKAWPATREDQHVHEHPPESSDEVTPEGLCACGFDWSKHELTRECICNPHVDEESSDPDGRFMFVRHNQIKTDVRIIVP